MTAATLLKSTHFFGGLSDALIEALAAGMVPITAVDGYCFVTEGDDIQYFMIIEKGQLARTKLSVDKSKKAALSSSIRTLSDDSRNAALDEHAVLVDIVEGYGTLTGLLHNIEEGECAYATVTAKGPAKVWLIPGDEFRSKISANPAFALEMMNAMAHELRNTSKVTRALAKTMSKASPEAEAGGNILRVLCYDTTSWVSNGFNPAVESFNKGQGVGGLHILMDFTPERLGPKSAAYAGGYEAICTFVNDVADSETMQTLSMLGVKMIAQRAAGFDRIDTKAALAYGMTVARVPAYSPYAVAEMGISLLMAVNRKIAKANSRVKMANFSLDEGLMGMDIHGKTVGVMGTGKIGQILCNIIKGFGANLICFDIFESDVVKDLGGKYVTKDELYAQSDVIFLMMPLLPPTRHTINDSVLPKLKKGVLLINTSRGGLVDTKALLKGLSEGIIAGVGMDVYENEADYFFQDWSAQNIPDPVLVALLGNNNVILTAHQAFFTKEAVDKIVATTIENMDNYSKGMRGTSHPNNCIPVPK